MSDERSLPWRAGRYCLSYARRALAYAKRRRREAGPVFRGWLILRRYSAHYRQALGANPVGTPRPKRSALYDLGVRVVGPDAGQDVIRLPADFESRVTVVARGAAAALECSSRCDFFPAVPPEAMAARTDQVPAVVNGDVIVIKLRDPFAIDGLHEVCEPLLTELERTVYGSPVIADKVYVYRSPVSREGPRASWLWHFDNHPREMLKVMVYLTDVGEDTAPFEYLRHTSSGRPQLGKPLSPLHGDSRVPVAEIERDLANGWHRELVTGPRGTVLVFDNNVVHRGTIARSAHRDVLIFQVRPALFAASPHIDPRWTGSFSHLDFNRDPWRLAPTPRQPKVTKVRATA